MSYNKWCIVVLENGFYAYTILANSEEELKRRWQEDRKKFIRWRAPLKPDSLKIKKTYLFFGSPIASHTI